MKMSLEKSTVVISQPEIHEVIIFSAVFVVLFLIGLTVAVASSDVHYSSEQYWVSSFYLILMFVLAYQILSAQKFIFNSKTVAVKYRLLPWKNRSYSINDCTGFFPYNFEYYGRFNTPLIMYGVYIKFNDKHVLKFRGGKAKQGYLPLPNSQIENIQRVIQILSDAGARNCNQADGYRIAGYSANARKLAEKALGL